MHDNRTKLKKFRPVLENPFDSLLDYLHPTVLASLPMLKPHVTLDSDLRSYFKDPRIRRAFSFQAKYLGMSPFRCPSLFSILGFLEHEFGVWHPVGGCNAVMKKMADLAGAMGCEIRLGEPVKSLMLGRRACGVARVGPQKADAVVINADFANAMTKLVPEHIRRRWNDKRIENLAFSCSTFMLYLGSKATWPICNTTRFCWRMISTAISTTFRRGRPCPRHPRSMCRTPRSLIRPSHRRATRHFMCWPVPHATNNIDWQCVWRDYRSKTLKRLSLLGIPAIRRGSASRKW